MDNTAKVTIIMSNYNQEKFIEQAIESVLAQETDFDWQLIITDDHSTKDNSVEIIKRYAEKYPDKIKALLNQENGRYLENILRAKRITKTPYFCLLDSDDYWTDNHYLQDAVNFLDENPDFVIYSRNVICQNEDRSEHLFVPKKIKASDFTIDNCLNNKIAITQTTGSFFRNVIFKNGVPEIMEKAVGTISERSFEGDLDRYIMHLKYGKAHYEPKPSGVYRILSGGIWSRLSDFEKNIIQAQCYLDYNEYYENKHLSFFINESYKSLLSCVQSLNSMEQDFNFSDDIQKMFFNVLKVCSQNRQIISEERKKSIKKAKLRYKILLLLYNKIRKKLLKKGLIQ